VGLAAYTSTWRLIHFGFVPLFGMSVALTAVTGAAYGARNPKKIEESLNYAVKLLLLIDAAILSAMVAFAPQISTIFTYTEASAVIYDEVAKTIKITAFILLFAPLGVSSASVFQGMGKGERSFAITVLRSVVSQFLLPIYLQFPSDLKVFCWVSF
jgi:Na+-driven multidrug efflux pump